MGQEDSPPRHRHRRHLKIGRLILLLIVVGLVLPVLGLSFSALRLKFEASAAKRDIKAHNYAAMAASVKSIGGTLGLVRDASLLLGWMNVIPGVRGYYQNGLDLLWAARVDVGNLGRVLEPVFAASEGSGGTASVNQAITQAGLLMTSLTPSFQAANQHIQALNPNRWPHLLDQKGLSVANLKTLSATFIRYLPMMSGTHPILYPLLGFGSPARYFLVFQNSGELRATGGFMTAYAYVPFSNGHLGKISSQNIQNLDTAVTYQPTPPPIVGTYLPVKYWHLRDANTAMPGGNFEVPDVPEAVQNLYSFYDSIPNAPSINGVIFINTWVVDALIGDVGGVTVTDVNGKTIHLTAQNANIEMETLAEGQGQASNVRKLFIGTVMKKLMSQVFHSHFPELMKVANSLGQALVNENVMLYFNNPQAESFVVQHHWGGVIPSQVNGNFMEVVDQNLLGHKDNYWVQESYQVNVTTEPGGSNLETVAVHWVNPAIVNYAPPALVVPYNSWVTAYAPMGSTLVSLTGSVSGGERLAGVLYGMNSAAQVSVDPTLNKVEFGAHISMTGRMNSTQLPATGTVTMQFWLPPGVNIHRMLLQKQPGLVSEPVTVTVNGVTQHTTLTSEQQMTF